MQGKHVRTVLQGRPVTAGQGCGECKTSCQSACKTSCTVSNQVCERPAPLR
ncbi:MAG: six-cysteine ranthipeptide SCIFF [Thermaerobacter sp.]|nr:six-cysteine ranthipeptide SCIFF [Thermaerobacter sp.]